MCPLCIHRHCVAPRFLLLEIYLDKHSWLSGWFVGACFVFDLRQAVTLALGILELTLVLADLELTESHLPLHAGMMGVSPNPAVIGILWCIHNISLGQILGVAFLSPRRHVAFVHSFCPLFYEMHVSKVAPS